MEEPPLLSAVKRIISGISIYEDHWWCSLKSHLFQGEFRYKLLYLREVSDNLPAAMSRVTVHRSQLEPVQCTASSKCIPVITFPVTRCSGRVGFTDHCCKTGTSTKLIVIVNILVSQHYPIYPLTQYFKNGMFRAVSFPLLPETVGNCLADSQPLINFTQQQTAAIRCNTSTFKIGYNSSFFESLEFK